MGREHGRLITFNDARYMAQNEGFVALDTIPSSNQIMKRSAIEYYLDVDTSYMNGYTMNRAVPYQLVKPAAVSGNAPVITSTEAPIHVENTSYSFQVEATNNPTSWSAAGLTSGLSINISTGLISGTAPTYGEYTISVTASNAYGSHTAKVVLRFSQHLNGGGLWYASTASGYCSTPSSAQYFYNANSLDQSTVIYNQDANNTKAAAGYYGLINDPKHYYFNGSDSVSYVGNCVTSSLSVSPSSSTRTSASQTYTISVSSNTSWTASDNVTWASLNPTSGTGNSSITVSLSSNTTGLRRNGTITVQTTDGAVSATSTVTQNVTSYSHSLGYSSTYDQGSCTASRSTTYTNSSTFYNSTRVYANQAGTLATAGYYSDGSDWVYFNGTSVTSSGLCGGSGGDPGGVGGF